GYRDSISQPRIETIHDAASQAGGQPLLPLGDFLLGPDYVNSRGSKSIGTLPPALATNATYAALRVIEQHGDAFEDFLSQAERDTGIDRELIAAKLMGRWRNGTPLVDHPAAAGPDELPVAEIDKFDYAGGQGADDLGGARCPIGAHIRRMNPRGGMV